MGTSSMYGGPGGPPRDHPLLPPDFNPETPVPPEPLPENPDDPEEQNDDNEANNPEAAGPEPAQPNNWQSAKTSMSKYASGSAGSASGTMSAYVKAYGGAKTASRSMPAGVRTTVSIGNFVRGVAASSFKEVLDSFQIDYEGKSAIEVLTQLIGVLAPSPVTREDAIARKALIITMEKVYELVDERGIDILDVDAEGLNLMVPYYIKAFIYERLLNDLGSRVETANISPSRAIEIERELKDYINSKVDVVLTGRNFSVVPFAQVEVERIYNQCYTAMEIIT